jgi:hypothetical protein
MTTPKTGLTMLTIEMLDKKERHEYFCTTR